MSLMETVNHSLDFLSPVKNNPEKLGLNPKFIFLHVSTQTVKASAVPMSSCSEQHSSVEWLQWSCPGFVQLRIWVYSGSPFLCSAFSRYLLCSVLEQKQ